MAGLIKYMYECGKLCDFYDDLLISSNFLILLTEAFAEIDGPSEKFIKAGSALVLNCTFKRLTEKPAFVFTTALCTQQSSREKAREIYHTWASKLRSSIKVNKGNNLIVLVSCSKK